MTVTSHYTPSKYWTWLDTHEVERENVGESNALGPRKHWNNVLGVYNGHNATAMT
jgi:hypothetical protein